MDVTEDSLKRSMDKAIKRYSSLFRLPSSRKVLIMLALLCIGGGGSSTVILFPSFRGLIEGLLLGLTLLPATFLADYVIKRLVIRQDKIFDLRRTMAFSLFCWAFWMCFIFAGAGAAITAGLQWWVRMCLLGFAAVMMLRLVVFSSTSSMNYGRVLAASFLQPFACMLPFLLLWTRVGYPITYQMPLFIFVSLAVGLISAFAFLSLLNRLGEKTLGVDSLAFFRAFMLNWVLDLNAPFEELLEKLGEEREVEVSLLKFGSPKTSTVIVVPSVHPGPFKNIGSSWLPAFLKSDLEKEISCVACVPHGLLGHEFDLASQHQNRKVIDRVIASVKALEVSETFASPFVKTSNGLATACCQIFGKSAFMSFTLAPKTIEDLPQELGLRVQEEAEKHGLSLCAVVNAHNSIDGNAEMDASLLSLNSVATACLEKAVSLAQLPFEVGSFSIAPREFRLEDGMGAGGITVAVVKAGEGKSAYVVIDGNNMVSGLRERVLASLKTVGVDDGEVFTTDTHSVSALILKGHGYHPIGEAMDNEKLIRYVREATEAAIRNIERAKVSCHRLAIPSVKVIGAKQLEALCLLIDKSVRRAKRIVGPIFVASGLVLMLFLLSI
jgi:putative membrane protein